MIWGLSLLGWFESIGDTLDALWTQICLGLYNLSTIFPKLFYKIWSMMAWFADQIESVFKMLAGLQGPEGKEATDMVSEIITDPKVRTIFGNLVGISTALLIFFTIVKIVQQHYKEKDGGNPYIIVFRTFKGLLMFGFVTAAVMVGLYATGVVFRALDKATGKGGASIAGNVFIAMAEDANRVKRGIPAGGTPFDRANAIYYNRVSQNDLVMDTTDNSVNESLKYTVAQVSGVVTDAQVAQAKANLPLNRWAIVNSDGTLSRLAPSAGVDGEDGKDAYGDYNTTEEGKHWYDGTVYDPNFWANSEYNNPDKNNGWDGERGHFGGEAGYKNDIVQGFSLAIKPAIDISYSPIDIWHDKWNLREDGRNEITSVTLGNMFAGSTITTGSISYKYGHDMPVLQPVGEDNFFSIDISGQVSLQGDKAAASFSLDMFKSKEPFGDIIKMIVLNKGMCQIFDLLLYNLPAFPLGLWIGPLAVDGRFFVSLILVKPLNNLMDGQLSQLGSGTSFNMVSIGTQNDLPVTLKRIEVDSNFEKLWSQLYGNWNNFWENYQNAYEADEEYVYASLDVINAETDNAQKQLNWQGYRTVVNDYNETALHLLKALAEYMWFYSKYTSSDDPVDADTPLGGGAYNYSVNNKQHCETLIEETYEELVNEYLKFKTLSATIKPRAYKAKSYLNQIYLPVFETSNTKPDGHKAADIFTYFGMKNTINLASGAGNSYPWYRVVDWSCYTSEFASGRNNVADIYKIGKNENEDANIAKLTCISGVEGAKFSDISKFNNIKGAFSKKNYTLAGDEFGFVGADALSGLSVSAVNNSGTNVRLSNAGSYLSIDDVAKIRQAMFQPSATSATADADFDRINAEFQKEIITFRDMSAQTQADGDSTNIEDDSNDVKALKKWVKQTSTIKFPNDNVTIVPIFTLYAEQIDKLMSSRSSGRRYLLAADPQRGSTGYADDLDAQQEYIGKMTYTDTDTVVALYDMWSMNFFVGFTGIIVALSVYMNFMFGLIQRAVNLAVLYIMSPITIAFYPFDDGQKFQSNFVMPFYKQAIGAYAVIMSLNIFIVLMEPVSTAASKAVGGGVLGAFMGVMASIAFCSMLPKIRDSINDILGAQGIQEKSLKSMMQDAGNALGGDKWKKVGKGALALGKTVHDLRARSADPNRPKKGLIRTGANLIGEGASWIKNKAGGALAEHKKKKQLAIEKEIAENKAAGGDRTKLSAAAKRMLQLQDLKKDEELVKSGKITKSGLRQLKWEARQGVTTSAKTLRDLRNGVETDDTNYWKAAADGVIAKKKAKAEAKATRKADRKAKVQNWYNRDGNLLRAEVEHIKGGVQGAKELGRDIKNSKFGQVTGEVAGGLLRGGKELLGSSLAGKVLGEVGKEIKGVKEHGLKDGLRYTFTGDVLQALGHVTKDTKFGKAVRWFQPGEQRKRQDQLAAEAQEWRAGWMDAEETIWKQLEGANHAIDEADQITKDTVKRMAAMLQATTTGVSELGTAEFEKRWKEATIADFKRRGMAADEAEKKAAEEWNTRTDASKQITFKQRGGLVALANDLYLGVDGKKVDDKFMAQARAEFNEIHDNKSIEDLAMEKLEAGEGTKSAIKTALVDFQERMNLADGEKLSNDFMKTVANMAVSGDSMSTIAEKIAAQIPRGADRMDEINQALKGANFENIVTQSVMNEGTHNVAVLGALNSKKKMEKAREWAMQDLNLDIDSAKFQELRDAYQKVHDPDGEYMQEEKALYEEFEDKGGIENQEFQRRLNDIQKQYFGEYEKALRKTVSRRDAIKYDYSVRQIEREQAEYSNFIGKQMKNRMDYYFKYIMSAEEKRLMTTDTMLIEMKKNGDYLGASLKLNQAVEAARTRDFAALDASGLDQITIDKFKKWANSGESGLKSLEHMKGYAQMTREFFGNPKGVSGGHHLQAVRNQMAAMFQVLENQEISHFYKSQIDFLGKQEAGFRNILAVGLRTIESDFAGDNWKQAFDAVGGLKDASGKFVDNIGKYIKDTLNRVAYGELRDSDAEYANLKHAIETLQNDWNKLGKDTFAKDLPINVAGGRLSNAIKMLETAVQATNNSDEVDKYSGKYEELVNSSDLIMRKIRKQDGGK